MTIIGLIFLVCFFTRKHLALSGLLVRFFKAISYPRKDVVVLIYALIMLTLGLIWLLMGTGYLDSNSLRFDR